MFKQNPEQLIAPRHPEQQNLEATMLLTDVASRLVDSPEVRPMYGVGLDSAGDEADDPAEATAVGTVFYRVVSVSGVPTGIRVVNFREVPTGLRVPDSFVKTTINFSEPLSKSNKSDLPVRIVAVQRLLQNGEKEPIGASAQYIDHEKGASTIKSMSADEENRTLMNTVLRLQKIQ